MAAELTRLSKLTFEHLPAFRQALASSNPQSTGHPLLPELFLGCDMGREREGEREEERERSSCDEQVRMPHATTPPRAAEVTECSMNADGGVSEISDDTNKNTSVMIPVGKVLPVSQGLVATSGSDGNIESGIGNHVAGQPAMAVLLVDERPPRPAVSRTDR